MPGHDAIALALLQNKLDHIAGQMGWAMLRSARSPIFSQSHDFSCFITDGSGRLLSQADGIPIHTGSGGMTVRALLGAFGAEIAEGDVFISSDPYVAGGTHLPDWVISRPVFSNGRRVAFVCNRAHQSDIGGGAAGTYNAAATEIFHEGIRLPPLKLVDGGKLREDLWSLLLLNSRFPDLLEGDLGAMLGSTAIGAEQTAAAAGERGTEFFLDCVEAMLEHADRRMRALVRELPDGTFHGAAMSDNDCFVSRDVWVRVAITIAGDELTVDFTGTDPQVESFKNSTIATTTGAVYLALLSFLDPTVPRNEGTYRCVRMVLPEGTLVNPRPPAAQTMSTVLPAHDIIHACWRALAEAAPDRSCAGWGKITHASTAGHDHDGRRFVLYHWGALPAAGAVQGRDGFNQIGHLQNLGRLILPNAEAYEQLYPVRFLRQEFRCDGGGAGAFRGGTGVDYEAEVEVPGEYSFRGEGARTPSGHGASAGFEGAAGAITFRAAGSEEESVPPQFGIRALPAGRLVIASPGGGGWGDPLDRDPGSVLRDLRDGVVSASAACEVYGVVVDGSTGAVDEAATCDTRAALRARRQPAHEAA